MILKKFRSEWRFKLKNNELMKSGIYLEHAKMKVKLLLWREMYGGVRGTDVG